MELRHLRYFVAVAEELHFRRAAERLHIAQPAISEQIRRLEAELGVALLTRSPRAVTLTPAGAAMLVEARRVLSQAEVARRAACEADERARGRLRIGYLPDALPTSVPRLLRHFSDAAPAIRVTLETGAARQLIDGVRDERIDLAVVCLPAPVSKLHVVPIGQEATVAAVPEGHPCAGERAVAIAGLKRTPLVQLARSINPAFYDGVVATCRAAGVAPALVEIAEPAVEQVLLAVAAGLGIALLPASAAVRYAMPGVCFKPLAPPAPTHEIAIVARPDARGAVAAFVQIATRLPRPRPRLALVA